MFYINCNPDSANLIENAAMEILKQYINNGPDAETLAKVQEQQIINRQNSKQNNSKQLREKNKKNCTKPADTLECRIRECFALSRLFKRIHK